MQLISPDVGLLIWAILTLSSLCLMIVALVVLLRSKNADSSKKILWALIIVFVPTIGSILFLTVGKYKQSNMDVSTR